MCPAGDANHLKNIFKTVVLTYTKSYMALLRIGPPQVAWLNTWPGAPIWFLQYCVSQDMCYCTHIVVSWFDISLWLLILVWLKVWMTVFLWSELALLGLFTAVILQRCDCLLQVKHKECEKLRRSFCVLVTWVCETPADGVQRKLLYPLNSCPRAV